MESICETFTGYTHCLTYRILNEIEKKEEEEKWAVFIYTVSVHQSSAPSFARIANKFKLIIGNSIPLNLSNSICLFSHIDKAYSLYVYIHTYVFQSVSLPVLILRASSIAIRLKYSFLPACRSDCLYVDANLWQNRRKSWNSICNLTNWMLSIVVLGAGGWCKSVHIIRLPMRIIHVARAGAFEPLIQRNWTINWA